MNKTAMALLVVVLMAGCGQKPKTKEYYLQHKDEMKAVLKDCSNRGMVPFGESDEARNCMAAANAEQSLFFR